MGVILERESDFMDTQYNNIDTVMEEKYINILKRKIIQSMVKLEGININDMTEDEILNEIFKFIDNADIELVIDYTDSILKQARNFYKDGHNELACLLYATWFEHWINDIITTLCRRKNLKEKDIKEIVRSVSLNNKYTWLLTLLEFNEINKDHINLILRLQNLRNSFAHYKWRERNKETINEEKFILENIEKTIKYLRNIENKWIYNNSKRKIAQI